MKKINYLVLGAAGLLLASCANEDLKSPGNGGLEITINLPSDLGTRADEAQMKLYYAVYSGDDVVETDNITFSGTQTKLGLNLLSGKVYTVAFFAQNAACVDVYDFDEATQTVSVSYAAMNSSDANNTGVYDCFYGSIADVSGDNETGLSVTLYRPLAQINWGATDLDAATVQNIYGENGANVYATLSTTAANSFNILTGALSGEEKIDLGPFQVPTATYPTGTGIDYVAMQYVLAPKTSAVYDLNLAISNTEDGSDETTDVVVTAAPLQANYRTNIYGSLFTDNFNINIQLADWTVPANEVDMDGAVVEIENGVVTCITPKLPDGVTQEDLEAEGAGAVAIDADGNPVYFKPIGTEINKALSSYDEIYFAKNAVITTGQHTMVIPNRPSTTIHGNGATITEGAQDFALMDSYPDGAKINLTISNLNGMRVWNGPAGTFTMNINLTNCTLKGTGLTDGTHNLVMTRRDTGVDGTINFVLQNCYVQDSQVGFHTTFPGTMIFKDCTFTTVGIPLNIAKKATRPANITVTGCDFETCGIAYSDTSNNAYDYAAPVRVVDNAGPDDSINLLVEYCTFTGTTSPDNILLMDYRSGKTWFPVKYTVIGCTPDNPSVRAE